MALAVSTMGYNIALATLPDSVGIVIPFLVLTLVNLATAMVLLKNIDAGQQVGQGAATSPPGRNKQNDALASTLSTEPSI
jgi:hypothetical protein